MARRGIPLLALTPLLLLGLGSPPPSPPIGSAARVTGNVRIEGGSSQASSVPSRYRRGRSQAPSPAGEPVPEVSRVVVYLEPLGHDVPVSPMQPRPKLDQKDQQFVPQVLPITVGTSVDITNQDGIYHNVFSLSAPKKFDIGRRPTGEKVPVRFDRPGVVSVFCDIHSTMSGFIIVLETPLFAVPDADGKYAIESAPAGRYRVHVWHPLYEADPSEITVPATGTVTLDLVLR